MTTTSIGAVIARTLATAWRRIPENPGISSEELAQISALLLDSGAGAIAWHRLQPSSFRNAALSFPELQQAYRMHTLQAAVHEGEVDRVFSHLNDAGIEALLVKGWAIARLYPEAGLRPYGDIDLVVAPHDFANASSVLAKLSTALSVDLHKGASSLASNGLDEIFARSKVVRLNATEVRVPSDEDHLQMLCIHFLRHGACRPLSLCDIAVAIESRPNDFDWDRCLGYAARRATWVASVIELAVQLLGASPQNIPASASMRSLPHWLAPTVLRQWGIPLARTASRQPPMKAYLGHPLGFLRAMRVRWPNAIEATVGIEGPFNNAPRLPFQLASCTLRTMQFISQS